MTNDVTYRGAVYPWHCDHVGHMNVMWYVGKFDEATWNFFARLGLTPAYLRDAGRGMAAGQQNITYKRELLAGDVVEVVKKVRRIRKPKATTTTSSTEELAKKPKKERSSSKKSTDPTAALPALRCSTPFVAQKKTADLSTSLRYFAPSSASAGRRHR